MNCVTLADFINGRLTVVSGTPVPDGDQSSKTSIYFTPYRANLITVYEAGAPTWRTLAFAEKSLSLSGLTASTPYDIFGYLSSEDLALESLAAID